MEPTDFCQVFYCIRFIYLLKILFEYIFKIISGVLTVQCEHGELEGNYKLNVESLRENQREHWTQEEGDHVLWFNAEEDQIVIGKITERDRQVYLQLIIQNSN